MQKTLYHIGDTLRHKEAMMHCTKNMLNNYNKSELSFINLILEVLEDKEDKNGIISSDDDTFGQIMCNTFITLKDKGIGTPEEVLREIACRCIIHDNSKLENIEEYQIYKDVVPKFKGLEYGTPEHTAVSDELEEGFKLHSDANDHHPEHFGMDMSKMDLFQYNEMIIDWCAACTGRGFIFDMASVDKKKESLNLHDISINIIKENIRLIISSDQIKE